MPETEKYIPEGAEDFVAAPTGGEASHKPTQLELAARHTAKELDRLNRDLQVAREGNEVTQINELRRMGADLGFELNPDTKYFELSEEQKEEYGLQ